MIGPRTQLWLCQKPADMRCQFDGLAAMVKQHMGMNPLSGHGFIFINKRRSMMKVLYFDPGGYCLWSKRLEQGQFAVASRTGQGSLQLSQTEFQALLDGLEMTITKRRKRWQKQPLAA